MPRVLIFANGQLPNLDSARALLRADDILIGADGGTRHIFALGLSPRLIVGDLDSLTDSDKAKAIAENVQIVKYPRDKNETDLELAIQHAREFAPETILVVAALGNRLDQTLANLALLSEPSLAALNLRANDGIEEAFFCQEQAEVRGRRGDLVSLIPWGDAVEGVRTNGLKWPLSDETLYPHKTRGVSNELLDETASIAIRSGLLLIVHRRL